MSDCPYFRDDESVKASLLRVRFRLCAICCMWNLCGCDKSPPPWLDGTVLSLHGNKADDTVYLQLTVVDKRVSHNLTITVNDRFEAPLAVNVDTQEYVDDKGMTRVSQEFLEEWLRDQGLRDEVEGFADALMTILDSLRRERDLWKAGDKVSGVRVEKVKMR